MTASKIIATCHIILPKQSAKSYEQFSELLQKFFKQQGISLATVQPEFNETETHLSSFSCLMKCSEISKINCDSKSCCNNENNCVDDCTKCDNSIDSTVHLEEIITTENL